MFGICIKEIVRLDIAICYWQTGNGQFFSRQLDLKIKIKGKQKKIRFEFTCLPSISNE